MPFAHAQSVSCSRRLRSLGLGGKLLRNDSRNGSVSCRITYVSPPVVLAQARQAGISLPRLLVEGIPLRAILANAVSAGAITVYFFAAHQGHRDTGFLSFLREPPVSF